MQQTSSYNKTKPFLTYMKCQPLFLGCILIFLKFKKHSTINTYTVTIYIKTMYITVFKYLSGLSVLSNEYSHNESSTKHDYSIFYRSKIIIGTPCPPPPPLVSACDQESTKVLCLILSIGRFCSTLFF